MDELIDKHSISLLISQLGLPMVTEVLEAFVPDAQANISFLQDNWHDAANVNELKLRAHSLKSSAANIGFKALSDLARDLESDCLNAQVHKTNSNQDTLNKLSSLLETSLNELALMGISYHPL